MLHICSLRTKTRQRVVSVEQRNSTPLFSSILESAEFGIYVKNNLGEEDFVPTEEVPLIENQGYGWLIELITLRTSVMWREIFTSRK
jgi:hypothetical protein